MTKKEIKENNRDNKSEPVEDYENFPQPRDFNPIWALIGMGLLIGAVLLMEVLGLKPK